MQDNRKSVIQAILRHTTDPSGFALRLHEGEKFDKEQFASLLENMAEYRRLFSGGKCHEKEIVLELFRVYRELTFSYHQCELDKNERFGISRQELFLSWEKFDQELHLLFLLP